MYHKHAQSINSGNRESHELKGMSKNYHTPLITKLVNRKRKAKVKVVGNPEMETGEYSCSVKQCTRDKQTGRQKGGGGWCGGQHLSCLACLDGEDFAFLLVGCVQAILAGSCSQRCHQLPSFSCPSPAFTERILSLASSS